MILPIQVTFRGINHSNALEEYVLRRANKLDQFYDRIMRCDVALEVAHRRQTGHRYRVRIDMTVPGNELVATRDPVEDVHVGIDEAFDEAQRLLQDYAHRRRGDVKRHEPQPRGRVIRMDRDRGFGFLETPDGDEIYFHRNSVLNGAYDKLDVGAEVRFKQEEGLQGPQASTVEWLRRRAA